MPKPAENGEERPGPGAMETTTGSGNSGDISYTYIRANASSIPNYGERYRAGEAISSSLAESTVNQVISMVKKQQMRWTPQGAHLLVQIRTRVLNDQLAEDFHRWYPNFTRAPDTPVAALAA